MLSVRIFPNHDSCLRLVRALAVETHEDWLKANRYPNMDLLKELRAVSLARIPALLQLPGIGTPKRAHTAMKVDPGRDTGRF